jgi:fatty acid desaturase
LEQNNFPAHFLDIRNFCIDRNNEYVDSSFMDYGSTAVEPVRVQKSRFPPNASGAEMIIWRDLVQLTACEKILEVLHPLPWLVLSLLSYNAAYISQLWLLGVFASFYFFLTGLRLSHGAQHYSLGLSRWSHDLILFTLSVLMLGSMHAVQASHLHHHRDCLGESDAEGATARLPWWRALLIGPLFPIRLHRAAWHLATPRQRKWIAAELIGIPLMLGAGFALPNVLGLFLAAMLIGECFTGFFAVWTVHHDCDHPHENARTQRGRWINFISYNMFFHAEHHRFPAVPTGHLPQLADRLDAAAANPQMKQVLELSSRWSVIR